MLLTEKTNTTTNVNNIIEQEEGDDLFVHKSQVEGTIRDGDTVEFDIGEGPKGPNAINVKKVE